MDSAPPSPQASVTFRQAAWGNAAFSGFVGALGLAWCAAPAWSSLGWVSAALIGAPCILSAAFSLPASIRQLAPEQWVVRVGEDALELQAPGPWRAARPLLRLPYGQIFGVRRATEEARSLEAAEIESGAVETHSEWLEIALVEGADGSDALLRAPGAAFARVGPSTLRVAWRHAGGRLTPGLDVALRALSRRVRVLTPTANESLVWRDASDGRVEALARELAASGRALAAVRLLRERCGWDLERATRFAEAVSARRAA